MFLEKLTQIWNSFLYGSLQITDSFRLPYWSFAVIAALLIVIIVVCCVASAKKKKAEKAKHVVATVQPALSVEDVFQPAEGNEALPTEVTVAVAEETEEPEEQGGKKAVQGSMEIRNCNLGGFLYQLHANNGQLLYESKPYRTIETCKEGAQNFAEAVQADMFAVRADKFKRYKFILKSPTSNNIVYVGESFDNELSCKNNINSVKRFASSPIEDCTDAHFTVHFDTYEIPEKVKKAVEKKSGATGKWEIAKVDEKKKVSPFVFLLYANNGQLLFESRDYKTEASCKKGIETFQKAVAEGQFVVDCDKSGHYKFILRNVSTTSLMEYVGQNYSTQRACTDGIESIYRFALNSSTESL